MAKYWSLKGSLGLAKLERGKVLFEFEFSAEAEKALKIEGFSFGGVYPQLGEMEARDGMSVGGGKKEQGLGAYCGTTRLPMGAGHFEKNRGCLWGLPRSRLSNREVGGPTVGEDFGETQRREAPQCGGGLG